MGKNGYGCSMTGCLGLGLGIAGLIGIFILGPVDSARTGYNAAMGDIPVIRERALDYCRRDVSRKNLKYSAQQVDSVLANELNYNLPEGDKINAQKVEMGDLWDLTEDHAKNTWQRWVWPSLD